MSSQKRFAHHGDGLFGDVHVINLDDRIDRWSGVAARLAPVRPARIVRCRAINGRVLTAADRGQLSSRAIACLTRKPANHRDITPGAAGCALTHLRLWRGFLANGETALLTVLEDDAMPAATVPVTPEQQRTILESVPSDVDLLLMGCNVILREPLERSSAVFRVFYFNGTFAYVITRRGAMLFLEHMSHVYTTIDHQMSDVLVRHGDVRAYSPTQPWFGHLWSSPTSIPSPEDERRADDRLARYVSRCQGLLARQGVEAVLGSAAPSDRDRWLSE
jgi:GR25 family glycosyltransferase involved in LPS biosynthesis